VQEEVSVVVMITQLEEGEPPNQRRKADQYWPDRQGEEDMGQSVTFLGGIKVDHQSTSTNGSYVLRKFLLYLPDGTNREVTQIQCEIWPDLDAPDDPKVLVDMVLKAQELQSTPSPILVHCSAGVGRTGTFIAVYKLWQDYQNPNVTSLAILPTVVELRQQRTSMVQRAKQYCYVAKCLSFLISMEEGDYYEGLLDGDNDNEEAEKIGENDNEETQKTRNNNNDEMNGEQERKLDKEQTAEEKVVETEVDNETSKNKTKEKVVETVVDKDTSKNQTDDEKRVDQKMQNFDKTNEEGIREKNENEESNQEEKKNPKEEIETEKSNMIPESVQLK